MSFLNKNTHPPPSEQTTYTTVHSTFSNTLRDAKKYEPPCAKPKEYRLLRELNAGDLLVSVKNRWDAELLSRSIPTDLKSLFIPLQINFLYRKAGCSFQYLPVYNQ